jgi:hypothetical protein
MERSGNTKAANVNNTIAVTREVFGDARVDAMIATLPPSARALLGRKLLAIEWVNYADWFAFLEGVYDQLVARDENKLFEIACKYCERDFGTVYKFWLRLGTPSLILDRTAKVWDQYYDFAKLVASKKQKRGEKNLVVVELHDFHPYKIYPIFLQAFIFQTLTMSGAKGLEVTRHDERIVDDKPSCRFEVLYD